MAITTTIPTIWSARITYMASQMSAFLPNATRAWEGDAVVGNTIKVPTIDSTTTINDYSRTSDLGTPEDIDASVQDLTIDQEKYFSFALEDLDARQTSLGAGQLIDTKAGGAGNAVASNVDEFVLKQLNDTTTSTLLGGAPTAATFNPNFVNLAKQRMTGAGLLASQQVCITTPEVVKKVEDGVMAGTYGNILQGANFVGGFAADPQASATFAFSIGGVAFYVSNSVNMRLTSSNAHPIGQSRGTRSIAYVYNPQDLALVMQVNQVEVYRLEKRFATGVKGLVNYGAKVLNAGRIQKFVFND